MPATNSYLTVRQVAGHLSVSVATIWRWTAAGTFPTPVRLGPNTTRWRMADIEDFLAARETAA